MKRRPDCQETYKFNQERPTIGLFIENASDMGQGYYPDILAGVTATVKALDANLFCFTGGCFYGVPDIPFDDQRNILYEIASQDNLDGLIIVSSIGNYAPSEEIKNLYSCYAPLPTVTIGTPIEGTPTITVDNKKGMIDTMAHLIEVHRYRRIAFIRGPEDSPDAEIRYQVYKDMLMRYGLPFDPELVVPGLFRFISGTNAIRTLIDERQAEFDAIIGANDHMALGALGELQARGFVVPYDVAVTGFDNIHQTKNIVPPMTTVGQPLLQLGEDAVHILLAKMAGEEVPAHTILPTELIIRRSCGCLKTQISVVGSQTAGYSNIYGSLAQCLSSRREAILANLVESVDFAALPGQEGAVLLLDSFVAEVVHGENGRFIKTIDRLLRAIIVGDGNIASWQSVVAVLRHHTMFSFRQDVISARASTLLYEAQVFISGEIRNVEAQQYLRTDRQNWLLHDIGQMLITMLDLEGLMEAIAESIQRLRIPGCYLVFYEDPKPYSYPQSPPEWSRLAMACNENGRIPINPATQQFPTRFLLPPDILPKDRRFAMMVQPLYFRDEQIGYVLLERGPHEGNIYELLHGQIASALKGALLLQAHKHTETELRNHRDHLDEMIQERTAELAAANKQLRQEITVRRKAEANLQENQKNLAYAQKITKLGYSFWNIETDEFDWSEEMYRIFGVDQANFIVSKETITQLIHPDDFHYFADATTRLGHGQETYQFDFRIITPLTQVVKYVSLWGEMTFAEDGRPVTIFNIFQDISVRRRAELRLEAYTAELERSNQELQEFAYVASHDLQEPLRKIQTFGDRIQQKYYAELDERGQSYIDRMQNAAARMQALIIALLAFSRVRTHTQPFSQVNLAQVVKNVIQELQLDVAEVGAHIEVSDLPVVEADFLQMHQLFQNLLSNALKYYRPDAPLQISVTHQMADGFCEIMVSDNGIGFEQEYAERVFNVFERLHNRDVYPGAGVGLAICRRIAERHGGEIYAQGKLGAGAIFVVRLRVKQPGDQY